MNISDSIKKTGIGIDKPVVDKNGNTKTTTASSKTTTASAPNTSNDSVTLSSASVQLQSLESGGVYDAQKVEEIKSAIANGSFSVDTSKVADGLLQTVKDLVQPKQG